MLEENLTLPDGIGVFDPLDAYITTISRFNTLIGTIHEHPGSIPDTELLTAAQITIDTLAAITELTTCGYSTQLSLITGENAFDDHNEKMIAVRESRTVKEEELYKMRLIRMVTEIEEMKPHV